MKKKVVYSVLLLPVLAGGIVYATASHPNADLPISMTSTKKSSPSSSTLAHTNGKQGAMKGSLEVVAFNVGVQQADLIVKVRIDGRVGEIPEPTPKSIFEAHIISTQKEDSSLNTDVIHIMQQGNQEFSFNDNPLFQEGEEYIFFLKKAVGSVADEYSDLYWILGEETNMYKSVGNDVVEKQALVDEELTDVQGIQAVPSSPIDTRETQALNEEELIQKIESEVSSQ